MTMLKEVMTTEFHAIPANATIQEAAKMMSAHDIGMVPVTEDGQVLGTLTDRDIVIRSVAAGHNAAETPVSIAMTPDVIYLAEDRDIGDAANVMQKRQVRRLIVVDAEKRPVGVASLGDLALQSQDVRLAGQVLTEVSK
jgi:predicted transcriptional regulator